MKGDLYLLARKALFVAALEQRFDTCASAPLRRHRSGADSVNVEAQGEERWRFTAPSGP